MKKLPGDIRLWIFGAGAVLVLQPWYAWTYSMKAFILVLMLGAIQLYLVERYQPLYIQLIPVIVTVLNAAYEIHKIMNVSELGWTSGPDLIVNGFVPVLVTACVWLATRKEKQKG